MIDLIDPLRKVIYRFNTDDQASVENFCLILGSNYHGNKNSMWFSSPEDIARKNNQEKFSKYSIVLVKTKIIKNKYKYIIGE